METFENRLIEVMAPKLLVTDNPRINYEDEFVSKVKMVEPKLDGIEMILDEGGPAIVITMNDQANENSADFEIEYEDSSDAFSRLYHDVTGETIDEDEDIDDRFNEDWLPIDTQNKQDQFINWLSRVSNDLFVSQAEINGEVYGDNLD